MTIAYRKRAMRLPEAGVFLHVRDDNARAIGLYERLRFRARRRDQLAPDDRGAARRRP